MKFYAARRAWKGSMGIRSYSVHLHGMGFLPWPLIEKEERYGEV